MDFTRIEKTIRLNITTIRKKLTDENGNPLDLNQEKFFDHAGIGEYKKTINSGPGKANYISKLEDWKHPESGSFPAALLPVYAGLAKCSIDDLFKDPETEGAPFKLNPIYDLAHMVAFNAYNACCFLEELYRAGMIDLVTSEDGHTDIRISSDLSYAHIEGESSLMDDFYEDGPKQGVEMFEVHSQCDAKSRGRKKIIAEFLTGLKQNRENISNFKGADYNTLRKFREFLTEELLKDVKKKEDRLSYEDKLYKSQVWGSETATRPEPGSAFYKNLK